MGQRFDEKSIAALRGLVRVEAKRLRGNARNVSVGRSPFPLLMYVAKTGPFGITGINGDTPGQGNVTLYNGLNGDLEEIGPELVFVRNLAGAVAADTYVFVGQDVFGTYWVLVENCPAGS